MDHKPAIGLIGTGVMGQHMCRHLIEDGYRAVIYNRTQKKAEGLIEIGAEWADSPAMVAARVDWLFSIVSMPSDVEDIYFGHNGILHTMKPGSILVDMTTGSPQLAVDIARQAAEKDIEALDAPVSGGDIGARDAKLSIMAGGSRKAFETVLPALRVLVEHINYMGPPGSGQHTKMSNQIHVAGTMISAVECLIYAENAGLDPELVIQAIGSGAAASWTINNMGPRMLQGDYEPGFYIDHFVKDMGIALEECRRMKLALPGLALVHQFYVAAQAQGLGKNGTQALKLVLEQLNSASS